MLVEARAAVNALDSQRRTPLHLACEYRQVQVAQLLVDYGAAVDISDIHGSTAIRESLNHGGLMELFVRRLFDHLGKWSWG